MHLVSHPCVNGCHSTVQLGLVHSEYDSSHETCVRDTSLRLTLGMELVRKVFFFCKLVRKVTTLQFCFIYLHLSPNRNPKECKPGS